MITKISEPVCGVTVGDLLLLLKDVPEDTMVAFVNWDDGECRRIYESEFRKAVYQDDTDQLLVAPYSMEEDGSGEHLVPVVVLTADEGAYAEGTENYYKRIRREFGGYDN